MISVRNFITWGGAALFILLLIMLALNGLYSIELTEKISSSSDEIAEINQINARILNLIHGQFTLLFITGENTKKDFLNLSFQLIDEINLLEKTAYNPEELGILNALRQEHEKFESLAGYFIDFQGELPPPERKKLLTQVKVTLDDLLGHLSRLQLIEVSRSRAVNTGLLDLYSKKNNLLILVFSIFTLTSALFFIFLNQLVMRPVKKLMRSTVEVAKGDLTAKVVIKERNEFGNLAKSFNRMLHELRRNKEEIEQKSDELAELNKQISIMNDDLEQKVQIRTKGLQESRAYLNQVIYSSPVGIASFDKDGVLTDLNTSFMKILELDKPSGDKKIMIDEVGRVASPGFNQCWAEALKGNRVKTAPERIKAPGNDRWYIHNFSPQVDSEGNLERILCYCEDVTDQIYAHDQLKKKNKELESFVYSVSHDLKSPIFTIFGLLEMVKTDPDKDLTQKQWRILGNVEKKLSNMRQMISALLDLSRAGANREKFSHFALKEMVHLSFLEEKVTRKGREATLEMSDLPEICADKNLITQLFRNLVSNSFKYSREDIPLKITLTANEEEHQFLFSYKDNGIGVDADQRSKVFEVFYRANPAEAEGAGVGLTIANKIVESHGGRIWIVESQDQGTVFNFTIPKYEEED